ncbi:MarR family winged helix-turn-helix transcriptional regulator [Rhodococcus tukisamuensis]|uniref:DNA-binding transcriptional regulator, MarR family n=1 Tax=Rhodococcus tukisamuensis TaxID=168276 RepID=A0A1G6VMK9_9NOCA|nr:MarR family transcriptional regulator [Rhodococcus tukisamuensis]SDD54086.1 DNA-binding transcriptional regulator, MarR family [Rhodococcus tukisamuensis]
MSIEDGSETRLREVLAELVTNTSRFTRLASSISTDDRPRAWMRALGHLDEYGALRISEFARIDRCSQPTATALLKQLTDTGLATRQRDPSDSRAVVVELTDAGHQWLMAGRAEIGATLAEHLPDMDSEEVEQLSRSLAALRAALRSSAVQR